MEKIELPNLRKIVNEALSEAKYDKKPLLFVKDGVFAGIGIHKVSNYAKTYYYIYDLNEGFHSHKIELKGFVQTERDFELIMHMLTEGWDVFVFESFLELCKFVVNGKNSTEIFG